MSKTPHNSNRTMNSDECQNMYERVSAKSGDNSELMTEAELIQFLRISEISGSANFHNVIEHLKKHRNLPRIYICNTAMYPKKAIMEWIEKETSE